MQELMWGFGWELQKSLSWTELKDAANAPHSPIFQSYIPKNHTHKTTQLAHYADAIGGTQERDSTEPKLHKAEQTFFGHEPPTNWGGFWNFHLHIFYCSFLEPLINIRWEVMVKRNYSSTSSCDREELDDLARKSFHLFATPRVCRLSFLGYHDATSYLSLRWVSYTCIYMYIYILYAAAQDWKKGK